MKLTVGKKLGLGFGIVLALMVLSSVLAYFKVTDVNGKLDHAFSFRIPEAETTSRLLKNSGIL